MREMKDSGVAWIGEIPEQWDISTINSLYTLRNQKVSDRDYPPLSVTMKGIVPQLETAAKTDAHDDRKLVKKGDFAINSRSDRRGSCGISDYDGSVSLINTVLTPRGEMHPVYYNWLFHSSSFANEFYRWGHGIVDDLWTTRWQEMRNITIPVPEYAVQQKIAAHLDRKCTQIDALISNAQQQIEKLKAYKQSVITETVTKGLDPDVQMKDSGVEWIGEIPEHWKIAKIKIGVTKVGSGKTPLGGAETYSSEGVLFLRSQNIYDEGINLDSPTYITDTIDEEMKGTRVKPYDVLLNITGGSIGRCCIFPPELERANVNQHVSIIRVLDSIFTSDYMHYYWNSNIGKMSISLYQTGGNREGMSADAIKNSPIMVIPIQEQKVITTYLDHKCSHIDKLITLKQQKIEKLQQYKKSLIYEYVTGKKEV